MGKNPRLKKPKNKTKQNKKTGNYSLCQVDSFTKDAGSKEGTLFIHAIRSHILFSFKFFIDIR